MTGRIERAHPTTDAALAGLYERATEVHTDAWVLYAQRALPPWWRLVREIRAECFADRRRDLVTWPMSEAAMRTSGLRLDDASYEAQGWRQIRSGPDAGRNVRVREMRRTARLVPTERDYGIRHPEAFTEDPSRATVHGVIDAEVLLPIVIDRWVTAEDR